MPMARYLAHHGGGHGEVFTNLPAGVSMAPHAALAADGVSCALCHQITPEGLGTRDSFNARFKVAGAVPGAAPKVFGPYEVDPGRTRLMRSSSGFDPAKAAHLSESEVCGSCHTLYTTSLGPKGEAHRRTARTDALPGMAAQRVPRRRRPARRATCRWSTSRRPSVPCWGNRAPTCRRHTFTGGQLLHAADAGPVRARNSGSRRRPKNSTPPHGGRSTTSEPSQPR